MSAGAVPRLLRLSIEAHTLLGSINSPKCNPNMASLTASRPWFHQSKQRIEIAQRTDFIQFDFPLPVDILAFRRTPTGVGWRLGWDSKSANKHSHPLDLFLPALRDAPRSFPKFLGCQQTMLDVTGSTVNVPKSKCVPKNADVLSAHFRLPR